MNILLSINLFYSDCFLRPNEIVLFVCQLHYYYGALLATLLSITVILIILSFKQGPAVQGKPAMLPVCARRVKLFQLIRIIKRTSE